MTNTTKPLHKTRMAQLQVNRPSIKNDTLANPRLFFSDPEAYESLRKRAFPLMMKTKGADSSIRIWVPGCSTGEEAYSLAIALLDFLGERASTLHIQIFATDISETIIRKARAGLYPKSIEMDMPMERLSRFFQKVDGHYQISRVARSICVFAKQDIGKDPPFSKLDMISCRNVMISQGSLVQRRTIPLFHYALNTDGILFLGSSKMVGGISEMFTAMDRKYQIYSKNAVKLPVKFEFVPRSNVDVEVAHYPTPASPHDNLQKLTDQILLNRFVPASVLVNDDLEIIQFIGPTGRYLDPSPDDASWNLLKLVKGGLHHELRLAFRRTKRTGTVRKEGIPIRLDGSINTVNFEILPVKAPGKDRFYLVVFEEGVPADKTSALKHAPNGLGRKTTKVLELEVENAHLREELEATRGYLQSIIEEQRATNEDLRSANEEIQSSNEELRSLNEELETTTEELQSTNEELTVLNEELQNGNQELLRVNNDLNNLLTNVNISIVMLGQDMQIRRFTPVTEKVMNLIPADVGRPITDIKSNLRIPDLQHSVARVMRSLETQVMEVEDKSGRWYSMRIRPCRTLDNKIDGVVIVLIELDSRLHSKQS